MTRLSYDEARLVPLLTDADIEDRVVELIGRASLSQLWLLFLDDENLQIPLVLPIDRLPSRPSTELTDVLRTIGELMTDLEAASMVIVLERYGSPSLTARDVAWARSLHQGCRERGILLRGILLSHRTGVRWVAAEDYLPSLGAAIVPAL